MIYNGFADKSGYFDPVMLQFILEEMVIESGAKLLYYTNICDVLKKDNKVYGVVIENKAGRSAVLGDVIIDCTGDGDVAVFAGVPFDKGNAENGENQPMSVRYMMSGVDINKFAKYINSLGTDYSFQPPNFHAAAVISGQWPLNSVFKKALDAGDLTYEDCVYWQVFGVPGKKDGLAFNCPEILAGTDGTNPQDLTNAQIYARKAIKRQIRFYKKYLEGFENAYLASMAVQVGVRESRRIKAIYELKNEDIIYHRKFSDAIVRSNYPIDVHGYKLTTHYEGDLKSEVNYDNPPYYEIPYRCLVPIGVEGLLVAGRCISAEFIAQSSLRIQPTVRAIGEAAGIAAAISINNNIGLKDVDGADVREEMIRRGAKF